LYKCNVSNDRQGSVEAPKVLTSTILSKVNHSDDTKNEDFKDISPQRPIGPYNPRVYQYRTRL